MSDVSKLEFWRGRLAALNQGEPVRNAISQELDWAAAAARSAEKLAVLAPPGCRVLDAGCGCGDLYPALAGRAYVGVDLVPEFVEQARKDYPGVRFEVADIRNLSRFKDDEFDVVVCRSVSGNFPKTAEVLPGLHRIARRVIILSQQGDKVEVLECE